MTAPISPEPRATPSPVLVPPPDSDLDVLLHPIDPGLTGSFPMLTGRICNRSTGWTATDIRVDFALYGDDGLLATP